MRIKSYGLLFDYTNAQEVKRPNIDGITNYLIQELNNFVLISYFKREKKYSATDENGFLNIKQQLFIEFYMTDTFPRKILYDAKSDLLYRIKDMPINQEFEPSRRRLYELPIELIDSSFLRFDLDFIRAKYKEMLGIYNAAV